MNIKKKRMASGDLNTESKKPKRDDGLMSKAVITDLNVDCLMKIFSTLSIKDLVYVVEADKSLLTAARSVFQQNYSNFVVEVSNEFYPKREDTSLSVKVIKHFGNIIRKLKVVYNKKYYRFNNMLDDMILHQCHKILSEIEIDNADELVFYKITQPFQELVKISFVSSDIPEVLLNFEKWFPNCNILELKKLKIDKIIKKDAGSKAGSDDKSNAGSEDESDAASEDESDAGSENESNAGSDDESKATNDDESKAASEVESNAGSNSGSKSDSIIDCKSDSESGYGFYGKPIAVLAKNYPTVDHFAISNVSGVYKRDNRVRNRDILKFIKLNPQIKSLSVESDDIDHDSERNWSEAGYSEWSYDGIEINEELAECIQKNLTKLENFHLIWKTGDSSEGCEFHFKKLNTLTIEYHIKSGHFYVGTDNVDVLNIVGKCDTAEYCADLLKHNNKAKVTTISGINWNNKNVKPTFKSIADMPNLQELQISNKGLKKKQIIGLLNSCKSLTKLTLDFDGNLQLFEASSKEFHTGIDLTEIGWKLTSHMNAQLVLKPVTKK